MLVTAKLNGELEGRHMVKFQLRKRWMPGLRVGRPEGELHEKKRKMLSDENLKVYQ